MSANGTNARAERLAVAAILVAALAAYASTLRANFVFDDHSSIVTNPVVQGPFSLAAFFRRDSFGAVLASGAYRPLTTLSFWVDQHVSGEPSFFHGVNLALYAFVLWLGHRFWTRWGRDAMSARARVLALACFAAMAIHVDVVAGLTARSELLAASFGLLACDLVVATAPGPARFAAALGALVCAILSRESALPMLVFVPLLAARTSRPRLATLLPFSVACGAVLLAMLFWRVHVVGARVVPANNVLATYPWPRRVVGAMDVFARYLEHVVTGMDLCPDYAYASVVPSGRLGVRSLLGGAALLGGLAALVRTWRDAPRAADAILGFGASYVVSSSLLVPSGGIMGDRFFFFPSFWLCALAAIGGTHLASRARSRATWLALAAVGVAYPLQQLALTAVAAREWRTSLGIYTASLGSCPDNHRLHVGEAAALGGMGAEKEGAWHLLIASAILRRFPESIDPALFPAAWEALPVDERARKLEERLGGAAEFEAVRHLAIVLGNGYRIIGPTRELLQWPTPVAIPPWDPRWTAPSTAAVEAR